MTKELKIVSINNIEFDTPLLSKEAFKRYKKEMKKIREENWHKFIEKFDLIENGTPIGKINNEEINRNN